MASDPSDKTDSECEESSAATEITMEEVIAELDRAAELLKSIIARTKEQTPKPVIALLSTMQCPAAKFGETLLATLEGASEENLIAPPPTPADVSPTTTAKNGNTNG